MRIRSTKPEFWRSRRIASVDWDARLVLKGLESYVDDNGVGKDDLALIVGDVFPRDMLANPRDTLARVSEAVSALHQAGLVWRYEVDGRRLLYISNWEEIQRIDKPGKGRLPRPDGTFDFRESTIRESVASPPVTLAPGTGEQGNRGTGEQRSRGAGTAASPPAARASSMPFDWTPTAEHHTRAHEDQLDIEREAVKFRAHAEEKGRTAKNWNAAFTRWLINAAEYAKRDAGKPARSMDRQGDILKEEMARARAADAAREGRREIEQ